MKSKIVVCKNDKWQTLKKVDCFIIHMSCGGGMGGSSWKEVALKKDNKDIETQFMNQQPFLVNTTRGKNRILNPNCVVSISRASIYIHNDTIHDTKYFIVPDGTECVKGDKVEYRLDDYLQQSADLKIKDLFE